LGGAASPPGEARGAVPRGGPRVRSAHRPPRPGTPGRSPQLPRSLGREGDKQVPQGVSPPRSEATLGGAASPPGEARGAVRRGGPRVRSAHRPPRPGTAGPVPPALPRSARSRGGQTSSLPPGAKRRWGEQPRRQARRGGPSREVVHEFAPLTAPLDPAQPGRSPQHSLAPLGREGDKQVLSPRSEATLGGAASPPGEARGAVPRGGPRVRSAHRPPRPGTAGPVPPALPRSARSRGGQTSSLPPGAKRHWGEQPRRQARRGGPSREAVDHEFASHRPPRPGTAGPVPPALPRSARSRGGQTSSLPPGAKRRWGEPRHQARRGGPSREPWTTSSLRSPPPFPTRPPAGWGQTVDQPSASPGAEFLDVSLGVDVAGRQRLDPHFFHPFGMSLEQPASALVA
jgi:hypothetical protein